MTMLLLFQAQEAPLSDFALLRQSLPYAGATLFPLLLALVYPLGNAGVKKTLAVLLGAFGVALAIYGAWNQKQLLHLDVLNPFFDVDAGRPRVHVVARAQAPFWQWCAAGSGLALFPALLMYSFAKGKPSAPQPALYGGLLGIWYVAARLVFEHFAAPREVVWATGIVFAMVLMFPFVGYWCGRRGNGWKGLAAQLLLLGLVHRLAIVALSYWLTTRHLGTHLDVHTIERVKLGLEGNVVLTTDFDRWMKLIAIPQLALWVPATIVIGLVLGALPFAMGKAGRLTRA